VQTLILLDPPPSPELVPVLFIACTQSAPNSGNEGRIHQGAPVIVVDSESPSVLANGSEDAGKNVNVADQYTYQTAVAPEGGEGLVGVGIKETFRQGGELAQGLGHPRDALFDDGLRGGTIVVCAADLEATPAAGDYFWVWDTSEGELKRVSYTDLIGDGALVTGGGTIDTGGFTFAIPATGTAALRNVANTFTALQTFNNGISLGNDTLSDYHSGTWTPVITGSSTNPTVTYSAQVGTWRRIGDVVKFFIHVTIATISGGSGIARWSLPFSFVRGEPCSCFFTNITIPGTPIKVDFVLSAGNPRGSLFVSQSAAGIAIVEISHLTSGSDLVVNGLARL
jgi:hypothetical protein